jgi:hypothetical protein
MATKVGLSTGSRFQRFGKRHWRPTGCITRISAPPWLKRNFANGRVSRWTTRRCTVGFWPAGSGSDSVGEASKAVGAVGGRALASWCSLMVAPHESFEDRGPACCLPDQTVTFLKSSEWGHFFGALTSLNSWACPCIAGHKVCTRCCCRFVFPFQKRVRSFSR